MSFFRKLKDNNLAEKIYIIFLKKSFWHMAFETKRDRTKICCLDLDDDLINLLSDRFDIYNGSLGTPVNVAKINKHGLRLLLNYDLPDNIQEYEVFVEDMVKKEPIQYLEKDHIRINITGHKAFYCYSYPPQTVFDPCPLGSKILHNRINTQRRRPAIKIAFQNRYIDTEYFIRDAFDIHNSNNETANNYMHLPNFCSSQMTGREVKLCDNELSRNIFESFLDDITYNEIYEHPTKWYGDNNKENDDYFLPLLMTRNDCVVSYIWLTDNDITIILPQTNKKEELLEKVFEELLYKHFSDYFPEVEKVAWINNPSYFLPNHQSLLKEKDTLEKKYKDNLNTIEQKIKSNSLRFAFLHNLLTSTGDELVAAMIKYFRWLGFERVIDKDKELDKNIYEEDIQIETNEHGMLVIEIKGINGTSTDDKCSQISKVVRRRMKEQKRFDVHGLYIVNHQRNIDPERRLNPPFNHQQVKDAENDERGLCYTWRLFNLYFEIEEGIISKEDARKSFFNSGLIDFNPQVIEIGIPHNYFNQHTVVCIVINDQCIRIGDFFYYIDGMRWKKVKIVSIQQDKKNVDFATNGSYGFGLEYRIPNCKALYIIK